jgi:hypothetical protein
LKTQTCASSTMYPAVLTRFCACERLHPWAYAQGGPGGPWPTPNSAEDADYPYSCERQMCWASEVTTRSTLGICTDRFQPVNVRPKHAAHHRYFPARIVASTHACIHASKSIGTSSLLFSARIADLHLIELQKLKRSEYTKT